MRQFTFVCMLCLVICFFQKQVYAQNNAALVVKGQVKDDQGDVYGATIREKGVTGNGTVTDAKGNFQLALKGSSRTIIITLIGFKTIETKVNNPDFKVYKLETDQRELNDVVVIGYQSQTRRSLTAAVSSIKGKDIANIPSASFDQTLQGRLPGVSVLSSTGEIGSRPSIVIRGATNVDFGNANGGNTGPLYVIDGVIYDLNAVGTSYANNNPLSLINPNDIESIDVLKDASASAIYGARAGNGVIIVKTKQAGRGKPQISGSVFAGVTTQPNFIHVATGSAERNLKLGLLQKFLPYDRIALGTIPVQLTDSL